MEYPILGQAPHFRANEEAAMVMVKLPTAGFRTAVKTASLMA
ncbi:hypothetical protein [Defluviimonas sp. D31]|nr:hypothetical protein [Defluviimonas sp. D31]